MEEAIVRLELGQKEIILIGTAHVSNESVEQVRRVISEEKPERVCVEMDKGRFANMRDEKSWSKMDIFKILAEKKGLFMLASLVLSSFQKKIGLGVGIKPGQEMLEAINICESLDIPYSLSDREVQVTLRRAWGKAGFWDKNKLLASLIASVFSKEELSEEEIEKMKNKNALQNMMEDLGEYLPKVKGVLIDERDRYLATNIYKQKANKIVAVIGAGHMSGIVECLHKLQDEKLTTDLSDIEVIPPKGILSKVLPFIVPAAVLGLFVYGFIDKGAEMTLNMAIAWVIANGAGGLIGGVLALAHPFTILAGAISAPVTSVNPAFGVGFVTGPLEAYLRKPTVGDLEELQRGLKGFFSYYKNRFTHAIVVLMFTTIGSLVGTALGLKFIIDLLGGA